MFALAVMVAAALAPAGASAVDAGDPIARLSWLAGCWERPEPDGLTQEQWMRPAGGAMLGMSRTRIGDRTVAWEHLRIEVRDGLLVYFALPSGQSEAAFTQTALTDSSVTFADPAHDFPQIVRYRLLPDGSVLAQIEGTRNGRTRMIDFPLARGPCPDAGLRPDPSSGGGN